MGRHQQTITLGGIQIIGTQVSSAMEGDIGIPVTLAAAKEGALTTRTSDSVGTLTMDADHGIIQADLIDIYWTGGVRYGVVVGVVNVNSVPITGGAGDVLPADETDITACVQTEVALVVTGDDIGMLAVGSNRRCHADFQASNDDSLLAVEIVANGVQAWTDGVSIGVNPLAGDSLHHVAVSNGDSAGSASLKIGVNYDAVA